MLLFILCRINIYTVMTIKTFLIAILSIFCITISSAQSFVWHQLPKNALSKNASKQYIQPNQFLAYSLDFDAFYAQNKGSNLQVIEIPDTDGKLITYNLVSTPVFSPELAAKYPGYSSYTGRDLSDSKTLKLSISPYGVHAMILPDEGENYYIDPYTLHDPYQYIVYKKADLKAEKKPFTCGLLSYGPHRESYEAQPSMATKPQQQQRFGDCTKRTYRLALACTGEYAQFHGGTIEKVLAAYNVSMTRVNGVYERDFNLTMVLVPNTDKLIFLNASTDPYTNSNGGSMLNQNQSTCDSRIGSANYDIGHVFSTGGGGIASLQSPCTSDKAQGVTGQNAPVGDPFDIDYVAHEMGHQFGAEHTQNNDCQRSGDSSMEPGSASTIMGYAGICPPNVQNNSDPHFHGISMEQISDFITRGVGKTCAQNSEIVNTAPSVTTSKTTYTTPTGTGIYLTAIAQDADGDKLTYCWEQMNPQVSTQPPSGNNTQGPNFRSVNPKTSPIRYMPDLERRYPTWEVLPAVARTMKFRCSVRDNNPNGGCTDFVDINVVWHKTSTPFTVTNPNLASVSWLAGTTQTITWDVASTNITPINTSHVDIFLSIDGGKNYDITLATNVENDGSHEIITPSTPSNLCRVMVRARENIFFDVSNANFKITTTFSISSDSTQFSICSENSKTLNLKLTKVDPANQSITLSTVGLPTGILASFDPPTVNLPNNTNLSLTGFNALAPGSYKFDIIAAGSGTEKITLPITFTRFFNTSSPVENISPNNGADGINNQMISFTWKPVDGAKNYTLEVSSNPSFSFLDIAVTTTSPTYNGSLSSGKIYFWRVRANTPCFNNSFGLTSSFRTIGSNNQTAILLNQNALYVQNGGTGSIDDSKISILTPQAMNTFVIPTSLPDYGDLKIDGVIVDNLSSSISYEDLIAGKLTYTHRGGPQTLDFFKFDIIDDKGRWLPNQLFNINIHGTALTIDPQITRPILCFGSKAEITVNVYGGSGNYSYSIDNGQSFQMSNIFTNITEGQYTIVARDDMGNQSFKIIEIANVPEIQGAVTVDKYDIILSFAGGIGNLSYAIDIMNYIAEPKFSDPGNGNYTIYIKDENGCIVTRTATIDIPVLTLSSDITTNIVCAGQKATIDNIALGGIPPYKFRVNNGTLQGNPQFSLNAGRYLFEAVDSGNKVVVSDSVFTTTPSPIMQSIEIKQLKVTLKASGGMPPYTYSIDGNVFGPDSVFVFPSNGGFKTYIKDSKLCQRTFNITINSLVGAVTTIKNPTCYGKNDGSIRLIADGGSAPFQYSFQGGAFGTTREWKELPAGQYAYTVTDNRKDTIRGMITLTQPDSIKINVFRTDNNVLIEASGGTPPYTYNVDNGAFGSNNAFTFISAGNYTLGVKDKNGCVNATIINITSTEDNPIKKNSYIFPNPNAGTFTIESPILLHDDVKIECFDIMGRIIHTTHSDINTTSKILNILDPIPGQYILKLTSEKSIVELKIIITK
jgi:hypothetical protein